MGDISLGQIIYTSVKPIFKIYMIIGVGFYLSRKNILTVDTSKNISAIAIKVLIPCLTFQKIVTNINNTMIHEISTIVIIAFFLMFSEALAVFGIGVLLGCPRNWWGGLLCCGLLPNISDLTIAYLQTLETSQVFEDIDLGVSFVMIYMGLQMFLQFTLGSYKFIEYDFLQDMQEDELLENNDSQLKETKSNNDSLPSTGTDDLRHHQNQNNTLNTEQGIPMIVTSSSPKEESSSDQHSNSIESIESHNSINTNDSQHLQFHRLVHDTSEMVRKISHMSRNTSTSQNTSKITLPVTMLQNPMTGMEHETIEDVVRVYSRYDDILESGIRLIEKKKTSIGGIIRNIEWKRFFWTMVGVWKDSFRQPASVCVVVSITISMIPWVQALFIHSSQVSLPNAPDKQPPLSFIMDFAGYIGAAQVPFGLLLLGGTIGRLRLKNLPKNLWRLPLGITFVKLFIFPIIGCAFDAKIYRNGMFYGQDILYFVSNINFCLPPATSLLYITAFYTPNDGKNHIQMDILALVYIFHYVFLVFCLPFTATYTMKVSLGF